MLIISYFKYFLGTVFRMQCAGVLSYRLSSKQQRNIWLYTEVAYIRDTEYLPFYFLRTTLARLGPLAGGVRSFLFINPRLNVICYSHNHSRSGCLLASENSKILLIDLVKRNNKPHNNVLKFHILSAYFVHNRWGG